MCDALPIYKHTKHVFLIDSTQIVYYQKRRDEHHNRSDPSAWWPKRGREISDIFRIPRGIQCSNQLEVSRKISLRDVPYYDDGLG